MSVLRDPKHDLRRTTSRGRVRDRRLGTTRRISVRSSGAQSNGNSNLATLSADGRFVIYRSNATNLVGDDSNGFQDYFESGPLR